MSDRPVAETPVHEALAEKAERSGAPDHRTGYVEVRGGRSRQPLLRHGAWGLAASLTRQQVLTRYRQSSLHLAWIVIQPVAFVGIYALFFQGVLQLDSGDVPYLSFVVAGIIPWRFIANGLGNTTSITDSIHLISKVYFPKELIPLSGVLAGLVDLAIGTVVIFIVIGANGQWPTYHVVALPLAYLFMVISTATVAIVVATLAVFMRDVGHAMTFVLIGIFFATPIMYTDDQLPPWLSWFPDVNPFAVAITQIRDLVLYQRWFSMQSYLLHLLVAVVLFVASLAYVRSVEARMVDVA